MTQSHGTQDLNGGRISDERLAEMLAGLEGVTPGPWTPTDGGSVLTKAVWSDDGEGPYGQVLIYDEGTVSPTDAAHIARCDPGTIRAILTELQSRRSEPSEPVAKAWILVLKSGTEGSMFRDYEQAKAVSEGFLGSKLIPLYASPNPGEAK